MFPLLISGRSKRPPKVSYIQKRYLEKVNRNSGREYISKTGTARLAKQIRKPCSDCKLNCASRITESERNQLFREYYLLGDINLQWQWIARRIERTTPKHRHRSGLTTRRQNVFHYNFIINGNKERVCKLFFLNTLAISNNATNTALKKCDEFGTLLENDLRGFRSKTFSKIDENK